VATLATLVALLAAACTSTSSADAESGPSATAVQDGVEVTLTLTRGTITSGEEVGVAFVVRNTGDDPLLFRGNGCALSAPVVVLLAGEPRALRERARDPRAELVADLAAMSRVPHSVAGAGDVPLPGDASHCAVDHGFSELEPGAMLRYSGTWPGTTVLGAPAEQGAYTVRGELTRLRAGIPLVPAAFRAARDTIPVGVDLPLTVQGRGGLTARSAAERLLAHPGVLPALVKPDAGRRARLVYRNGTWELRILIDDQRAVTASLADAQYAGVTVKFALGDGQ